jgi:carbamoyl-phosphate synthase large subunit
VTVKIPRWDINKFKGAQEEIGSSMKSVGEVMGIGRNFEEAYQKAIRMLDLDFEGAVDKTILKIGNKNKDTKTLLTNPTPNRMFAIAKAFYENFSVEEVYALTGIDPWFLYRIKNIVDEEKKLLKIKELTKENLLKLKILGFSDKRIGLLIGEKGLEIRALRKKYNILPSVFSIDTLAGEFPAKTNYLYLTYGGSHDDVKKFDKDGVIVLGSGPYRIGSSVEFDWTCVNTIISVKENKKKTIVINCNPETVSTDYDISDRLYFEELTFERITDIYEFENPHGVVVSVGGQTPNNRAKALHDYGCKILGTNPDDIDRAEDRRKFSALLDSLSIAQPAWSKFTQFSEILEFSEKVGLPVLIRPSYVLSGSNMKVCRSSEDLKNYLKFTAISEEHPVTVSKFVENAKEIEVDAVADRGEVKAFVISEHVENAGVHSGDASIVFPPQKLYGETEKKLKNITVGLAKALNITGPFNMQCLAKDNEVSVIEVNLRSSRTFPFISKVTGVNLIKLATGTFFHNKTKPVNINPLDYNFVASKVAQFSFARLFGADPVLDVEMASTGEVACFGQDVEEAFLLAELSVGGRIPKKGIFVSLSGDDNKLKFLESARFLMKLNLPIFATEKTAAFLNNNGVKVKQLYKIHEHKSPNILDYFQSGKVDMAINITDNNLKTDIDDDYYIRRSAVDQNIPLFTNLQKAELFIKAVVEKDLNKIAIKSWAEFTRV